MNTTTNAKARTTDRHVGIDVGKAMLDITIYKADKIDTRLIAKFGVIMQPDIKPLCSKKVRYIKDLLARKRQLNIARTQELNRSHKAVTAMKATHNRLIKVLDEEIEWGNTSLAKAVGEVTEWQRLYEILSPVPGVGDGVEYTLMGGLPELGSLTNHQVAAAMVRDDCL